ncbi:mutS protein 4-like protein [Dinothrombium tinctorium]|uniref:MutS protein 4-like protein n=1 Tax=Dinothrombium tinctorium TaxID=1965070 RepID=A0A3S3NIG6_9ACAR|nr:mutS protein 4-like protein [Dinothrombium tinctorium]RWS03400.1 mutS protein 4-like protein [Dinothrombium tinctorium]RWS17954.1 mutS protein 4-like protein [Dinothrombium tinctorium]
MDLFETKKYSFDLIEREHESDSDQSFVRSQQSSDAQFTSNSFRRIGPQQRVRVLGTNTRSVSTIPRRSTTGSSSIRSTTSDRQTYVLSVVEGRGLAKGEIGVAAIDLIGNTLVLSQFSDAASYSRLLTKLDIFNPIELIVPSNISDTTSSVLYNLLRQYFPQIHVVGVERKFFNETVGSNYVRRLCSSNYEALEVRLQNKFYALSAVAGLIRYIEHIQSIFFVDKSLKIVYRGTEEAMSIDFASARSLEIIVNQSDPKSDQTLLGLLNYTKTRSGLRALRATLMEPPSDKATIENRIECVDELICNVEILEQISHILGRFLDVEHLISLLAQRVKVENEATCEKKIDIIIYIKHILSLVPTLKEALEFVEHPLLKGYEQALSDPHFAELSEVINEVIHEGCKYVNGDINVKTQKCYAIKQNVDDALELARKTYSEKVDDVNSLLEEVKTRYSLPINLYYSAKKGYFFQMTFETIDSIESLPSEFVQITRKGKKIRFSTEELIQRNNRVKMAADDVFLLSAKVINGLFDRIREYIIYLQQLTEVISTLDMLASFAMATATYELVKPEFTNILSIEEGWHPLLKKDIEDYVHNDTVQSLFKIIHLAAGRNVLILMGLNMSGKSTHLKQVALLQIMAQSGCFVAAKKATFRIADQIFTRIGSNDDIESNCSTFAIELKETLYIFENLSENSLVLIDELGRGTSLDEGLGFCLSVIEHLVHIGAFTLLATHFTELSSLRNVYPTVIIMHFQIEINEENGRENIKFTHKLVEGGNQITDYGIKLAKMTEIGDKLIKDAQHLHSMITPNNTSVNIYQQRELKDFELGYHLMFLAQRRNALKDEKIREYLLSLR